MTQLEVARRQKLKRPLLASVQVMGSGQVVSHVVTQLQAVRCKYNTENRGLVVSGIAGRATAVVSPLPPLRPRASCLLQLKLQ